MRDQPAATGIGVLKTLLGTYIIIIAGIVYAAAHDGTKPLEDPVAIEQEATESYTILSYNGKVFAVNSSDYETFRQSEKDEVVLVDALNQEPVQSVINKNDLEELTICSSYDEAVNYISGLDTAKAMGR